MEQNASAPCQNDQESDFDLIIRFLNHDEPAFDALLLRHQQKAFSIAYGLVGNYEDATEVTQDAFVKIYNALPDFRRECAFTTWLYRIVTNLAHNKNAFFLRRGKGRTISIDDDESPAARLADHSQTALEELISNERGLEFLAAMEKLSAEKREVLVLYSVRELSYEEIAETLEISTGTVKSRLFRAREELMRILKRS